MIPGPATAISSVRLARPGRVLDVVHARLRPPAIDRTLVEAVLDRYGLRLTKPPRNLPSGWRNRSVVAHTTEGRKVLKRYRDDWAVPTIVHEHSILHRLEYAGFPAVRLVATVEGETLVQAGDGRYAVFEFEHGRNLAGHVLPRRTRVRLWAHAGRLLARFHRDLRGFTPAGRHHLGFRGPAASRWRDTSWHLRALQELPRQIPRGAADTASAVSLRWLGDNAARVADQILELEERLADAPLERVVIHGDFGIHNLLIRRDGTSTVHDLELARLEWRLLDLVIVLSRTGRELGRAFLDGYDGKAGAPAEERRYLREVWEHYHLCGGVQSWSTYARLGGEARLATARRRIEEADRISRVGAVSWEGAAR